MFPPVKILIAVTGAIVSSSFLGPKLGAKLVGPEQAPGDVMINNVKEYGAIIGVGLGTYVVLHMLLRA